MACTWAYWRQRLLDREGGGRGEPEQPLGGSGRQSRGDGQDVGQDDHRDHRGDRRGAAAQRSCRPPGRTPRPRPAAPPCRRPCAASVSAWHTEERLPFSAAGAAPTGTAIAAATRPTTNETAADHDGLGRQQPAAARARGSVVRIRPRRYSRGDEQRGEHDQRDQPGEGAGQGLSAAVAGRCRRPGAMSPEPVTVKPAPACGSRLRRGPAAACRAGPPSTAWRPTDSPARQARALPGRTGRRCRWPGSGRRSSTTAERVLTSLRVRRGGEQPGLDALRQPASVAVPTRVQVRAVGRVVAGDVSPARVSRSQRGAAAVTAPARPAMSWV